MEAREIVLPETKPETEWVRGRALQKVSPKRGHAMVQRDLLALVDRWGRERGETGAEWRFRVAPPGEVRRPLVPDVAYVASERLRGHTAEELEAPPFAPTVAFEILSTGDAPRDVASKVDVYLRAGAEAVVVLDPARRTIVAHDARGARAFRAGDAFAHPALPGLTFAVGPFFENALKLRF